MVRNVSHLPDDEKILVTELKSGNEQAWHDFVERYKTELFYKAFAIMEDADEATDMVQELFIALWEKRSSLSFHTSLKGYLYQSIKNRCLDRLEILKVHQKHRRQFMYLSEETEAAPQQEQTRDVQLQNLFLALEKLSTEPSFKAFQLTNLQQKSGSQAAKELGLREGTVRVQASRLLHKLKIMLNGQK